jgi:hypothetical protein
MAEKINITHHYDKDADILYIDFGSDEPCFTEDLDGFLMIDIGWFSKLPRGAKIISPKAHKIRSVQMIGRKIERKCRKLMQKQAKLIQTAEPVLETNLVQMLNRAFACVG